MTYACYNTGDNTAIATAKLGFIVSAASTPETAIFSTIERFLDTTGNQVQFTQKNYLIDTLGNISFQSLSYFGALTSTSGATTPSDIQFTFKSQ